MDYTDATDAFNLSGSATKTLCNATMTNWGTTVWTNSGGLMVYGASSDELRRYAATFVDKILKGAKPGDLPFQQPTKYLLVINLKTAKAIGITMPMLLVIRAEEEWEVARECHRLVQKST